jgi:hypothetical protein
VKHFEIRRGSHDWGLDGGLVTAWKLEKKEGGAITVSIEISLTRAGCVIS